MLVLVSLSRKRDNCLRLATGYDLEPLRSLHLLWAVLFIPTRPRRCTLPPTGAPCGCDASLAGWTCEELVTATQSLSQRYGEKTAIHEREVERSHLCPEDDPPKQLKPGHNQ